MILKNNALEKKIKVLQVIDVLEIGGAEQICILLTNLLKHSNYKVALLLLSEKGEMYNHIDKSVDVHLLNKKTNYNIFKYYECAKIIQAYDIVHVHMRYNFKYVSLVHKLFRIKNKVILHDHYGNIEKDRSVPKLFKSILKPKFYIGVSNTLTDWANKNVKLAKDYVFLLSNVVPKKDILNEDVSTKKGMVLVANIKPIKNQLHAIRLTAKLNTTLTIYGNIHDEVYYKMLLNEIKLLNIEDKVKFIHGVTDIQPELNKYEIGLMCSVSESGPLVLIEYLAQNLPFLSYNTGEVSKTIKYENSSLVIDDFDEENWLERIKLIKKQNLINLNDIYDTHFSSEKYLKQCVEIYSKILTLK